jgi:hypothetical protein
MGAQPLSCAVNQLCPFKGGFVSASSGIPHQCRFPYGTKNAGRLWKRRRAVIKIDQSVPPIQKNSVFLLKIIGFFSRTSRTKNPSILLKSTDILAETMELLPKEVALPHHPFF